MPMPVSINQWKQVAAGGIVSLGCCSQGLAAAFSSSAIPQMTSPGADFFVTENEASLIASILYFTAAAGNLSAGPAMNLIGRKMVLLISALPITIGFILVALSQDFTTIMIGRVLMGFFTGATIPSASVYISESTEASIRGTIALFPMFSFTIGNLLEFMLGAVAPNWRIMTWISTTVPVAFFVCMLLLPETPRHSMSKNKKEEALKAMTWLRPSDYDVRKELNDIEVALSNANVSQINNKKIFTLHNLKMYVYALVLGTLFGTCGGSVLVLFAEPLIIDLHSFVSPKIVSVIMGAAQLVGMCISLCLVDTVGRRRLLQISGASMSITALSLSLFSFLMPPEQAQLSNWNYFPAILAIIFMFCFALGYRGIPFGLSADLLPTEIRALGAASTCVCAAVSISLLSGFFLSMIATLKIYGTFLFYGCICCICFIFPTLCIPETKGKSLEELQIETKGGGILMGIVSRKHQPNKGDMDTDGVENFGYKQES